MLIIGGDARLAQRLAHLMPPLRVIRRSGDGPGVSGIADYAALPEAAFDGVRTVVNCVGTAIGDAATLTHVNVEVTVSAARQARAAGCRHYIIIGSLSVHGHAPGKFGVLARAMRVARVFPVPRELPQRSVLHLDNAAAVVAALAANPDPSGGIVLAADHQPFDLKRFAAAVSTADGIPVRLIRAPDAAFALMRAARPGLYASLFAASLIDPAAAVSTGMMLPVGLDAGLAEMLAVGAYSR